MGQPGGAHHQAEHQREEVAARELVVALLLWGAMGVTRIGLAVGRQPAQGARALVVLAHLTGPALARRSGIARQRGQLAAGGDDEAHVRVLRTQGTDALTPLFALALQGRIHILQACLEVLGAL